ncbi:MAG: hypothetical protein RL294_479 [Actinomycetota bacterium]
MLVKLTFSGDMFEWRGPSPFYFVRVPDVEAARIAGVASMVTYGWGVIPVTVTIGSSTVTTSLFPKDGGYLVPIKNSVRLPEKLSVGDLVNVTLSIAV